MKPAVQPALYEALRAETQTDIQIWLDEAFSNAITFGGNQMTPLAVKQVAQFRLQQLIAGKLDEDAEQLLRQALTEHLIQSQAFSRIWLQADPDPDQLVEIWDKQTQSMARWGLFAQQLFKYGNARQAYVLAYEDYAPEGLHFATPEERRHFIRLLLNEQQRMILFEQMQESSLVQPELVFDATSRTLSYQGQTETLEPALAELLELLWDEMPHSKAYLIKKIFGTVPDKARQDTLSRKVSKLNDILEEVWGKASLSGKNWITGCKLQDEPGYQLFKPRSII